MKRPLMLGLLVLLLAAVGLAVYLNRPPGQPPPVDATVRAVAALGRIQPAEGILEVGADATRRVGKLFVQEGQAVKQGDVLAHLDNYDESQAAAAFASAQYEGGKAQLAYRTALEEANIAKAEAELRSIEELAPLEIAMQSLTVEKGKLELELTQKEARRLEKLVEKGSVSREDVERKTTEAAQRTLQVKSAQEELNRQKAAFALNRAKAQANLESARANLKYAQAGIDLDSLGKSLEQARARLDSSVIRAPAAGKVLRIRSRPGEVVRNPGLLTLGDLQSMWVIAEVYESDLLRIREGQPVRISSAALPEALTGKVTRISRLISRQTVFDIDPKAATDARVAEVRILLDRADPADRLINLQVTAVIDVTGK